MTLDLPAQKTQALLLREKSKSSSKKLGLHRVVSIMALLRSPICSQLFAQWVRLRGWKTTFLKITYCTKAYAPESPKSEACDPQTCFSKAERSETAAMLTFASRLDTSVNISEVGSHQQQRLVQPACRLKQTFLHQITLKIPSTFPSDPEIQFKNDPMVILMKAEIPCVQGEKWEDTCTRWANPNKSYFICIPIKGWALKLSWSVIKSFPN